MHLKPFFGKAASFLLKSASYALGVVAVLALTFGTFFLVYWMAEGDAAEDLEIGSIIFSIPVFVGSAAAYVCWFVPMVGRTSFFADWINARPPQKAAKQSITTEERHRFILRVLGGVAVPISALFMGVCWELGSRDTRWSGMGMYPAIAVAVILCGLYFGAYLPAVNSGRLAIGQRGPVFNGSFSVSPDPLFEHPEKDIFIVDPRKGHDGVPRKLREESSQSKRGLSDGASDRTFTDDDCKEWFN